MRRLAALCVLIAAGQAAGQAQPTAKVMNCLESGCHTKQVSAPFLHGPTAVGACDSCHEYADPAKHTFTLKRQGRELCAFCHIDQTGLEFPHGHEPVIKGDCISCHNPHGGETRRLLSKPTVNGLCISCHQQTMAGSHSHKPAAEDCTSCHAAHSAPHEKLLKTASKALCLSCHESVNKVMLGSAHPHKPMEGDCMQCHSPHASDQIRILTKSPQQLCLSCHENVGKGMEAATHPHSAATDAKSCLNCHAPHGSDHAKQMLSRPVETCMACHQKPIVVSKAKTVAATTELTAPEFHKHGPIQVGNCSGCHDVHGGMHEGLLAAPYERAFYQRYTDTAYGLCFKCHDRTLVVATSAEQETGFRNGTKNLHAVHVNKGDQGRSCRACHTVHASRNEAMIADSVAFGQWRLPLNFAKTGTGGSCGPGCHRPASYDRVTPVAVPLGPAPAAIPAPRPGS